MCGFYAMFVCCSYAGFVLSVLFIMVLTLGLHCLVSILNLILCGFDAGFHSEFDFVSFMLGLHCVVSILCLILRF